MERESDATVDETQEATAEAILRILDELGCQEGWDGSGLLVHAEGEAISVRPLEDRHPQELLLGLTAPDDWRVFGLLMWGWASPMTGRGSSAFRPTVRPSEHPKRCRSRTVMAVDRRGAVAARTRVSDGRVLEGVPQGGLLDSLLRVMGRPTPPPDAGTAEFFAVRWLEDVIDLGRELGRQLTWKEAALTHPALLLLARAGKLVGTDADQLIPAAQALAKVGNWDWVRRDCIERPETSATLTISPRLAEWMDTGMFARWVMGGLPPLPVLMRQAAATLPPTGGRRLRRVLEELGVDTGLVAVDGGIDGAALGGGIDGAAVGGSRPVSGRRRQPG